MVSYKEFCDLIIQIYFANASKEKTVKKIIFLIISAVLALSLISCKKEPAPDTTAELSAECAEEISDIMISLGFTNAFENSNEYFVTYVSYLDKEGEIFSEDTMDTGLGSLYMKDGEDSVTVLIFDSVVNAKKYRDGYLKEFKSSPYSLIRQGAVVVVGNKEALSELDF